MPCMEDGHESVSKHNSIKNAHVATFGIQNAVSVPARTAQNAKPKKTLMVVCAIVVTVVFIIVLYITVPSALYLQSTLTATTTTAGKATIQFNSICSNCVRL